MPGTQAGHREVGGVLGAQRGQRRPSSGGAHLSQEALVPGGSLALIPGSPIEAARGRVGHFARRADPCPSAHEVPGMGQLVPKEP